MEVTVKITKQMIKQVQQEVKELTGREPTQRQLEQFFRKDVNFVYKVGFEDGLGDSVDAHFG